jgi:hypothetical protein
MADIDGYHQLFPSEPLRQLLGARGHRHLHHRDPAGDVHRRSCCNLHRCWVPTGCPWMPSLSFGLFVGCLPGPPTFRASALRQSPRAEHPRSFWYDPKLMLVVSRRKSFCRWGRKRRGKTERARKVHARGDICGWKSLKICL